MSKNKGKPSVDELMERARALIEEAADRDALYDRVDDLYDQTRPDAAETDAENVQLVKMPYGTNAVDLVADLAAQMERSITIPAAKETAQAKRDADLMEEWLLAWVNINERLQQSNFTADAAWFGAQRSQVIMRCLYYEPAAQEIKRGNTPLAAPPVILQIRDPRYVYHSVGVVGLECVVEGWQRTAAEIRRTYPDALDEDEYPDDAPVDWVEYWDDKYRCYWAAGEAISQKGGAVVAHGYGCVPYSVGTARKTPRAAPGLRYRPLLSAIEDTLRSTDTWFSVLATAGYDSVTNAWAVFSDHYGYDSARELDITPDAINYFRTGEKIEPIQRATLPSDFFQLGTLLREAIQQATFPLALYGQAPSTMAGYAVNLITQAGRRSLNPIWEAIERAYEGALANCLTILREKCAPLIGDEIPLLTIGEGKTGEVRGRSVRRSLTLDVNKIDPAMTPQVSLSDPMPSDEAGNLRMAIEAVKGEILSQQTALEKFKLAPDALAEMDRIAVEKIVRQLQPVEAVKLAVKRGYVPEGVQLPQGWQVVEPGQIMPDVLMPQPVPQPEPQQPNPADMQALSGAGPMMPEMSEMAGEAPVMPAPMVGGF